MTTSGTIPQSTALTEATPESLGELLSRDPERYSDMDWIKVIEAFRDQRVRWAQAEAMGARSAPKAKALPGPSKSSASDKPMEELDL